MASAQEPGTNEQTAVSNAPVGDGAPEGSIKDRSSATVPAADATESNEKMDAVMQSDIGIATLLNRLKQSISSARDFAIFLRKRSVLEDEHAQGLKKLSRGTCELIRRPENRQGTFAQNYEEITYIHDHMADHGLQFAMSLHQMSDELQELAANMERGRKYWKQTGTNAEKRLQDSEAALEKAKSKYDSLAEQYDRARTGEKQHGRFGLKGPKSAAQQEEDLHRKVEVADADYAAKVQAAQVQRRELAATLRPQAISALRELIQECDSGLTMQLQKFAILNEQTLLRNGLCISPLKDQQIGSEMGRRGLREVVQIIDNDKDFRDYVLSFSNKAGTRTSEIRYEKHPALSSPKQSQPSQFGQQQPQSFSGASPGFVNQTAHQRNVSGGYEHVNRPQSGQISGIAYRPMSRDGQGQYGNGPSPYQHTKSSSYPQPQPLSYSNPQASQLPQAESLPISGTVPAHRSDGSMSGRVENLAASRAPGAPGTPYQTNGPGQGPSPQNNNYYNVPQSGQNGGIAPTGAPDGQSTSDDHRPEQSQKTGTHSQSSSIAPTIFNAPTGKSRTELARPGLPPPLRPVFGVSLDDLYYRDHSAVPMIVYQCVQAVDLFGLDVEGVYRTSGSASHLVEMKAMFDHDSSQVDFRNPAAFHHDIASVTTLLKHFFRDLPDPLLTSVSYSAFINAAKIDDDNVRRDSLHSLVNSLPDPNYATLRVLTLHLYRVSQRHQQNRMTRSNLAICFGPTLMGQQGQGGAPGVGADIKDASWQARVIETILNNTLQIFDDDD